MDTKDVHGTVRGFTKLQALFRGNKCRRVHVERARNNLPWSPFVPAKLEAVRAMLEVAELQPEETLVDIGSGDGRVVIEAALKCPELKKARGIELDEALVKLSRRRIIERALQEEQERIDSPEEDCRLEKRDTVTTLRERVEIIHADFMEVDMRDADVVVLFFLPHEDIARSLQQKLRPDTRVVTYVFQIAQWKPEKVIPTVPFMTEKGSSSINLYRVPSVLGH
ncbi:Cyclopropane-fatty-acyl-phospholipid synthase [Phytophthora palmivora]|uniref:Cyclopropane-fatty-acyl-phospholipid synthase n=1 Tax=Phytophthora palmivora TaxID=4796 RepID=A0A2P4YMZ1_9STRA|nr:Cyclopropane-fatty-acyl-phospholipid synthase [Phytophthora palmivora]